jgi:hypothetical protein
LAVAVAESWTGDDVADVLQQLISTLAGVSGEPAFTSP